MRNISNWLSVTWKSLLWIYTYTFENRPLRITKRAYVHFVPILASIKCKVSIKVKEVVEDNTLLLQMEVASSYVWFQRENDKMKIRCNCYSWNKLVKHLGDLHETSNTKLWSGRWNSWEICFIFPYSISIVIILDCCRRISYLVTTSTFGVHVQRFKVAHVRFCERIRYH